MKILNFLNSINTSRDSSSRLKNITNRIKTLENDINTIQVNKNKSFIERCCKNKTIEINNDINRMSIFDEFMKEYKNKNDINNEERNRTFSKIKSEKLHQKRYLKKSNEYKIKNNILQKKRSIINYLNTTTEQNNNFKSKKILFPIKEFNKNILNYSPINKNKKSCSLFSFDSIFLNQNDAKQKYKNSLIANKNTTMKKLDYEFQIFQFKKKLENLKREKKEKMRKLNEIKNINKFIEEKIFNNENHSKPLNRIISLLKNISLIEGDSLSENILLNVMDIKYSYENDILINEFLEGIKNLLKINTNNYSIETKLKELINAKNDILNLNNKYIYLLKENQKYFIYIKHLLNLLNLSDISEINEYIKGIYIKNIQETNNMEKIKVNLMKDMTFKKEKLFKKMQNFSTSKKKNNNKTLSYNSTKKFSNLQKYLTNIKPKLKTDPNKLNNYYHNQKNKKYSNKSTNKTNDLYYSYNNLNQIDDNGFEIQSNVNNSSRYYLVSNGKDKKIKVNKNNNDNRKQKDLIERIKKIKINNIRGFYENNKTEKNDSFINSFFNNI